MNTEQEPRPTPLQIESVLSQLRGGIDGFRDHWDYYQGVSEFRIDCLMEDAVKVIEHLQQSQAKSLTPEQVKHAKWILRRRDEIPELIDSIDLNAQAFQLLREVVGE